jgi:hypothetical protein
LLATVVGHAAATRVLPLFGTGPTATGAADFAYLAYALLGWPWIASPYYFVLALCGALHLGLGVHLALPVLVHGRIRRVGPSRAHLLGFGVFALLVALGVAGVVRESPRAPPQRFPEYRALFERVAPFLVRHQAAQPSTLPAPPTLPALPRR